MGSLSLPPPTTLLVHSSFSCFSRCRSHSHFIHLKLSVWGSCLPDVLPLCCLCPLPSQPFFPLLSIFLYQNYTMQGKLMQVCTLTSMRFSKLAHLMGRQTAAPRGVGMDVRLFRPRRWKQVRNCYSKNSASLFSLMRDNKQANSTAYGWVQAGRCSKRPCRSLPYGVTNCDVFFFSFCMRQRGAPKELVKGRKTQAQNWGKSFDCFDVALSRFFLLKQPPNWALRENGLKHGDLRLLYSLQMMRKYVKLITVYKTCKWH